MRLATFSAVVIALGCMLSQGAAAQDNPQLAPGTPERRQFCGSFSDYFGETHSDLSSGVSIEQFKKQIAIELAGDEAASEYGMILVFGVDMANYYIQQGLSADEMTTDFLFECVTTPHTLFDVLKNWFENEIPQNHSLREMYFQDEVSNAPDDDIQLNDDGSLAPGSYHALLGDEFGGTQSIIAYERRKEGAISACGIEYSHMVYDHQYSQGQPVKISGSINVNEHPVSILAGLIKVKVEKFVLTVSGSEPQADLEHLDVEQIYVLIDGEPILENTDDFECEDPEYSCHIVFSWEKVADAIINNSLGLAYRPAGGGSDVILGLDMTRPEGAAEQHMKFNTCMLDLMRGAAAKLESR